MQCSPRLYRAMWFAIALLLTKVFVSILWEYRGYFPADFESAFLSGKRVIFHGSYRVAFYAHIISGPVTLLIATFLIATGGRTRLRSWHRWTGRTLLAISMLVMLPSGLVIAQDAYAGPAATLGFTTLTIITVFCLITAARYAALRNFQKHKMWAIRSFILLVSPLILRLASGVLIWFDWESELAYSLNAWLSWMLPLFLFESTAWFKPKRAMAVADTTIPAESYRTTQVS